MRRGLLWGGSALMALTLLSGCKMGTDDEMVHKPTPSRTIVIRAQLPLPELPHGASSWRAGLQPVVSDNRITIGKQVVDVAPLRADSAVVTLGGTYFLNDGELWFLQRDGAAPTGFTQVDRLIVSGDGRYLGFVDRNHGPQLPGDDHVAAAVVYDTTTGGLVLRSSAGMGQVTMPLRHRYQVAPPVALTFEGSTFFATTPSGTWRYPLSGKPAKVH